MQILTRRDRAVGTAELWERQYRQDIRNPALAKGLAFNPIEVYDKLLALGKNPNPDDVDAAIGNKSWTSIFCAECLNYCEEAVLFACESECECVICKDCLQSAVKLVK